MTSSFALVRSLLVLLAAGGATAEPMGDATRGERVYAQCQSCHEVGQGAVNRIGPHLNGVFGRRLAGLDDYTRYSPGLTRAGADGVVWTAETLDAYIANPRSLVTGTRMNFAGLRSAEDRADVIAYLRIFSDSPANIPEAQPTARATNPDLVLDPAILAIRGDPAYGEYLAGECTICHQRDGSAEGIPSITGWPVDDFVIAMHAYKKNIRINPAMNMMASRLSDEEIAALAAYFNALQ